MFSTCLESVQVGGKSLGEDRGLSSETLGGRKWKVHTDRQTDERTDGQRILKWPRPQVQPVGRPVCGARLASEPNWRRFEYFSYSLVLRVHHFIHLWKTLEEVGSGWLQVGGALINTVISSGGR